MRTTIIAAAIFCVSMGSAGAEPVWNTGWNWDKYVSSQKPQRGTQQYRGGRRTAQRTQSRRQVAQGRRAATRVVRAAPQRQQRLLTRLAPEIAKTPEAEVARAITGGGSIINAMASDIGKNLRSAYRGLPYCGLYLGTIVQRLGYQPPAGHALAINWRNFGVNAGGPAPGVIMVSRGHVGVVKEVLPGGRIVLRGGNQGGGRVNDIVVSAGRAVAWRRPG